MAGTFTHIALVYSLCRDAYALDIIRKAMPLIWYKDYPSTNIWRS